MELILYKNFTKRINSTKQPTGGTVYNVTLKQDTSVETPTFIISGIDLDYNYAKWNNHYYFIDDIVLLNNEVYELHCSQDVLATYKSDIQGTTAFVEYCDSFRNKWIPDRRYSMSNQIEMATTAIPDVFDTHGTIILNVAGVNDDAQVGFTTAYAIDDANAKLLSEKIYDESLAEQWAKLFGDPYKAIIEAHWVPWAEPTTGTTLNIGDDPLPNIEAKGLHVYVNGGWSQETEMDIPWIYNDWRDFSPYAVMQMYLPFYGIIELDQSKFVGQSKLKVITRKDPISGEVLYQLSCGNWMGTYRCDASVQLGIGQTNGQKLSGIAQFITGVGTLVGGIIATVASDGLAAPVVAGIAAGGVGGIASGAITYFKEETSGRGGTGGFSSGNLILKSPQNDPLRCLKLTLYAHKFSSDNPDVFNTIQGAPYFDKIPLSQLSGYVKCAGASVSISGLASDREQVNQWLNQGIFIE